MVRRLLYFKNVNEQPEPSILVFGDMLIVLSYSRGTRAWALAFLPALQWFLANEDTHRPQGGPILLDEPDSRTLRRCVSLLASDPC